MNNELIARVDVLGELVPYFFTDSTSERIIGKGDEYFLENEKRH